MDKNNKMEFGIEEKQLKSRRKSDSSVESLAPTDIPHPSLVEYDFYFGRQHICPLTHNLMEGNALAFRNLVLQGQRLKRRRWKIYEGHFRKICLQHLRNNGDNNLPVRHGGNPNMSEWQEVRMANENCLDLYSRCKVGKYGKERKHLYIEVIAFLLRLETETGYEVRKRMKESFFLLWDIMPFPYVRIQEMRKMLENEWATKCTFAFKLLLERAVDTYGNEFSDISVGDVEPRELQHLCKCKIRHRLWHNRPKKGHEELNVDSLLFNGSPLPQRLVSYLRVVDRRIDSLQESGLGVRPDIKIRSENSTGSARSPKISPSSASSPNDPPGSASPPKDHPASESSPNDPHGATSSPNDPQGSADSTNDLPVSANSPNGSFVSARSLDDSSDSASFSNYNYCANYYDDCSD